MSGRSDRQRATATAEPTPAAMPAGPTRRTRVGAPAAQSPPIPNHAPGVAPFVAFAAGVVATVWRFN
ncbi:hypothetical protein ACFQJD_18895 [Haloplanus sp. GCM10025708]|uniref:hypothetical protein n=1 Tax=Haloferacaceae TaxID=1644056 RepID=UPI0036142B84